MSFTGNKTVVPQKGDKVDFNTEIQGITIKAGLGEVSETGADFIWVIVLDGNPNLNHNATIHATGKAYQPVQDSSEESARHEPDLVADDGWGESGNYQQVNPEGRYIREIIAAQQACDFLGALQLAEQARAEIPNSTWLQQNFPTLEILARRSANYQNALNGAYRSMEQGQISESIGLLKQAMQNASVPCGQDKQVLSLLEQAKVIAQMERDEAIEQARSRSIVNAHDSESYRVEIEKKRAQREAFGQALSGNLLGLLGAFSSVDKSSSPKPESSSDQDFVQKLVGESEQKNSDVLNKWRESQGWPTTPQNSNRQLPSSSTQQRSDDSDMVRQLVNETEQNNSEVLNEWRESQGWK